MGLFDWFNGLGARPAADTIERFEKAIDQRGGQLLHWNGSVATVQYDCDTLEYDLTNLVMAITSENRDVSDVDISDFLNKLTTTSERRSRLLDFSKVNTLLRPRVTNLQLAESQPRLCKLPFVPNYLVRTLTVDWGDTVSYVTNTVLKAWDIPFQEAFDIGIERLMGVSSVEPFDQKDGPKDIWANNCFEGIASSGCLILRELFPYAESERGILFAVPNDEVLLAHIVSETSSKLAPVDLMNVSIPLYFTRPGRLSREIFWYRREHIDRLNTSVHYSQFSGLTVDLVCEGVTKELMKLIGAVV